MNKLYVGGGAAALVIGVILLVAGLAKVGESPAKLTWRDPEVKSALMTFATGPGTSMAGPNLTAALQAESDALPPVMAEAR